MAYKGKVLSYSDKTGYGFIKLEIDNKKDYFMHRRECLEPVKAGDLITCDLQPSRNMPGTLICVNTKKYNNGKGMDFEL